MSRPNPVHGCVDTALHARRGAPARGTFESVRRHLLGCLIGGVLAAGAAALPAPAWAQSANATVRGKGPPNTQVTAFNTATGTTRNTRTGADGSYALVGLQPGTYQIDVGPGTRKTVRLTVASTSTLNFDAATAAPASGTADAANLKGVTVTAGALPDVATPEVGETISLHQIATIPQISRNFLEFADTVPGMVFTVSPDGNTSLRGGAERDSRVNVYIDGVGQKSYLFGGPSGQFATQGNPFPQLAIGEYKVITSNYKAEYGQISSAAVTAQSKSGTNAFHGEVFDRYTSGSYRARTPAENAANEKTPSQEREFGFALGGPIVKDKAHFFFTYEGKRFDTPTAVVPAADAEPAMSGLPPEVASEFGPANLNFEQNYYFGKVDWEPSNNDRIELSGQVRKETQVGGVGNQNAQSAGFGVINDDKRYTLRWQHSGDAYFNELLLSYQNQNYAPTAFHIGNGSVYTYENGPTQTATLIGIGAAGSLATQSKGQKGISIKDDLTLNALQWHGDHVVKLGFVKRLITLNSADAADQNPQFYYNVTPDGTDAQPYEVKFPKPVTGVGLTPTLTTHDKQFGAYIQDDWSINDHLILNLGVRWDYERAPSYTDFVTPAAVVDALNSPNPYPGATPGETYADALAKGGVDINDYISTGRNRSAYKGEWQPRLGFSYDINADQAHVIHGGAGRSYDRNLYNYLQLEVTKAALPQFDYFFQDPATGECYQGKTPCVPFDSSYLDGLDKVQALAEANVAGEIDLLNNHLKAPYSDQYSLGMANQIGEWQTDATIARVLSYDGFAFTLGNRYPDGDFYQDKSQPWGQPPPGGFGNLIIGNNGIETRTTQVLLSANKPYTKESHWGVTLSYTYTNAKQNRDVNEHYDFDYATIGDYPFILSNAAAKHRLVATGVIDGPWGITLSAKLTLATPLPYNGFVCYPDGSDQQFPNGGNCRAYGTEPKGNGKFLVGGKIFGYRNVDFQATKHFDVRGLDLYARFDLLNVFNFRNYSDLVFPSNTVGSLSSITYNTHGNITYVPRTIKFELGMKF